MIGGCLPAADARFTLTVPVVVAGAGAAGLTAALSARDGGAAVLVVERDASPSGTTGMSLGALCAAGTAAQAAAGIEDGAEALERDILSATRRQTDPALVSAFAAASGPTVDWLVRDHGVSLELDRDWVGLGHPVPRLHAPPDRSGETLIADLLRATGAAGADLLTAAVVTALYADDAGRVCGVRLARPGGGAEDLGCRALILATCGFAANHELVARHIPDMGAGAAYCHEGSDGTAIRLGEAAGAALADLGAYQGYGLLAEPHRILIPHTMLLRGGLLLAATGRRFTDETTNVSYKAVEVLRQPGGIAWCIYDDDGHRFARASSSEYRQAERNGAVRRAEDVSRLAAVTGMPVGALEETLAEVAELAAAGGTDRFGRQLAMAPAPPLYAIRVTGALFHTQGGLAIDTAARVLGIRGGPIQGLYAAGGAARGLSGPGGWGYLPGMGLGTAVAFGRLAGGAAAMAATGGVEESTEAPAGMPGDTVASLP